MTIGGLQGLVAAILQSIHNPRADSGIILDNQNGGWVDHVWEKIGDSGLHAREINESEPLMDTDEHW